MNDQTMPDPRETARKRVRAFLAARESYNRSLSVGYFISDKITQQLPTAHPEPGKLQLFDDFPALYESDLRALVADEQPQDEQDGDGPTDLYWPFTGALDTCYGEHDDDSDGYRECCMRAGLAYALKLHEQQVSASVADERDGDVRAVAEAVGLIQALWNGVARPLKVIEVYERLEERFADRIVALEARDAKAGESQ